ncbi:hypothetical protein PV10_06857 [Exophiala mesophila]|uniref:Uncharacterized protein n=1 Tax=Exophiala mesophila TaxID=212818 RepID=A0A0D1ZRS4_EXOME|nr:uncharacterized protein PV10_06857 [Exophiala mesophila]KIV89458.1 hypothetical protein PV10_06857 [Exophiala mesophila]
MARARKTRLHRAECQPEQREFFEQYELEQQYKFQPPRRHDQEFQQPADNHNPIQRFEILKSTPVGLIFPQNVQYQLRRLDPESSFVEQPNTTSDFVSNDLKWWKQKYLLPPTVKIFASRLGSTTNQQTTEISHQGTLSRQNRKSKISEFEKCQPPATDPYPFAVIKYPGWQGVTQFTIDLTLYHMTELMHYDPATVSEPATHLRTCWRIKRLGFSRQYIISPVPSSSSTPILKWRSSKTILDIPELQDGYPKANGNLKLEDADANLIAVYKQRRDWDVLGSITVFTDRLRDGATVELVFASCLGIVTYERIGWQNGFGY